MNGMSNYTHRIVTTTAIASLIIGLLLGGALGYGKYSSQKKSDSAKYHSLWVAYAKELNMNSELRADKESLTELLTEWSEKYKLVTTLRAIGWEAETPEQARLLLEELSKLPLGTPFTSRAKVTSKYGVYSIEEYGWDGVDHPGIDLKPLNGNPAIMLPATAEVVDFGESRLWGKYMLLETEYGYQMFFAHLDRIFWHDLDGDEQWSLTIGDILPRGSKIANMGSTGQYATGPHLHYEIRTFVDNEWQTLDPEAIIEYTGATTDEDETVAP